MVKFFKIEKKKEGTILDKAARAAEEKSRHQRELDKLDRKIAIQKKRTELARIQNKGKKHGGGGAFRGIVAGLGDVGQAAMGASNAALGIADPTPRRRNKKKKRNMKKKSGKRKPKAVTIRF